MPKQHAIIRLATVRRMPPVDAQAIRCGFFAVHAPDGSPLSAWPPTAYYAITHCVTGCQAACIQGKTKALNVARRFSALLNEQDFTEADFAHPWSERYRAWVEQAKAIAKEYAS